MAKKAIRPLRSEADYEQALAEIERYFDREPAAGTPEADRFDLLALVIEDYERKHWPVEMPNPVDAIRLCMDARGRSQADLGRLLGSRQRASDILAGKRPLTLDMVRKLNQEWGVPAEALIQAKEVVAPRGSSAVREVEYDSEKKRLYVTFVSGKVYVYDRVPSQVAARFDAAPSKGKFFNQYIRDQYPLAQLRARAGA